MLIINYFVYIVIFSFIFLHINRSKSLSKNNSTQFHDYEFKGMTFVGDKYCPEVSYNDSLSLLSMSKLQETGANWVAVVVTEYQDYINSTEIYPLYEGNYITNDYYTYKTESIEGLTRIIKYAQDIGLKVMLKPHIDLSKEPNYTVIWRGNIGESFTTQDQWNAWFKSYENFLTKYADLAELLNVEMFSISCELIATSKMAKEWKNIIKIVREKYKGKLTDSANHDGEEYNKTWWGDLDYIGVDAYYYPIQTYKLPEIEKTLEIDLLKTIQKLKYLSHKYNKPVIFTEIGFCSGNCTIGNRDYQPSSVDHYIQAHFYESFLKIFSKVNFVKGFFWWAWNSDPYYGGKDDNCISPQGKLSEYVLRNYYGGNITNVTYLPEKPAKCKCTI